MNASFSKPMQFCCSRLFCCAKDPFVEALSSSRSTVSMRDCPWLRNPFASVHAVALTNLAELTSGLAVLSALGQHLPGRTRKGIATNIEIQFTKKARGKMTAYADDVVLPTDIGSHNVEFATIIRDNGGEQVARAVIRWSIRVEAESSSKFSKRQE